MNQKTLTLSLFGVGSVLAIAGGAGVQRKTTALTAKAQAAMTLANLEQGNQWLYEYSWPNGKKHEFILHVSRKIETPMGPVFELKNFSNTLKGQLIVSYDYLEVRNTGLFQAESSSGNNTKPGFVASQKGACLPIDLTPGASWKWNALGNGVESGTPTARSTSLFIGKVLSPKTVATPLGKKVATVVQVFEKVQWLETTRRSFYVPGLGKVREELLDAKGNLMQRLELKKFTKDAKEIISPLTVETGG